MPRVVCSSPSPARSEPSRRLESFQRGGLSQGLHPAHPLVDRGHSQRHRMRRHGLPAVTSGALCPYQLPDFSISSRSFWPVSAHCWLISSACSSSGGRPRRAVRLTHQQSLTALAPKNRSQVGGRDTRRLAQVGDVPNSPQEIPDAGSP